MEIIIIILSPVAKQKWQTHKVIIDDTCDSESCDFHLP